MVDITTYSEARQNLAELMDRVVKNGEAVIVARKKRGSVVLVSLREWNSIQETMHLMSSPANARTLLDAMDQADRGDYAKKTSVPELREFVKARIRKPARRKPVGETDGAKRRRRPAAKIPREAAE